jgi:anti-sigma regulatory factor (Ser/Thr protein kinase)
MAGRTGAPVTYEASATFPGDPRTPGLARSWALARIREGQQGAGQMLLDDAALVISELVTNALRAGSTSITVNLQVEPGRLRVAVQDRAAGRPRLRHPDFRQTSGRGLQVVSALADDWGVIEMDSVVGKEVRGKEVWAELALVRDRVM